MDKTSREIELETQLASTKGLVTTSNKQLVLALKQIETLEQEIQELRMSKASKQKSYEALQARCNNLTWECRSCKSVLKTIYNFLMNIIKGETPLHWDILSDYLDMPTEQRIIFEQVCLGKEEK